MFHCPFFLKLFLTFQIQQICTLSIWIPPWATDVSRQPFYGRASRLNREVREKQESLKKFSTALPCLRNFLKVKVSNIAELPVAFVGTDASNGKAQLLMRELMTHGTAVYTLTGNLESYALNRALLSGVNALIVSDDPISFNQSSLNEKNSSWVELCGRKCVFYVVITESYGNYPTFLKNMKLMIHLLWERERIGNAIVAARINSLFWIVKSTNFRPGKPCEPAEPNVILSCCTGDAKCNQSSVNFNDVVDLNNCVLKSAYFDKYPYTSYDNGRLKGVEVEILRALSSSLRFELNFSWIENETDYEEVIEQKIFEGFDLIFGGISQFSAPGTDRTTFYDVTEVVWLVPYFSQISLRGLIDPFTSQVWYVFLTTLVIAAAICLTLRIKSGGFLEMTGLIVGVTLFKQPGQTAERIYFITWAMMSFFAVQFYQFSLAGQLISNSQQKFESIADLVGSQLKLLGPESLRSIYATKDEAFMHHYHEGPYIDNELSAFEDILQKRLKYEEDSEFLDILGDLNYGKINNLALLVLKNLSRTTTDFSNKVYVMDRKPSRAPLSFVTWKGFPVLSKIDDRIYNLVESGLIGYWGNKYIRENAAMTSDEEFSATTIRLKQFSPGLLVLSIGFGSGVLLFFIELGLFRYREYKLRRAIEIYLLSTRKRTKIINRLKQQSKQIINYKKR